MSNNPIKVETHHGNWQAGGYAKMDWVPLNQLQTDNDILRKRFFSFRCTFGLRGKRIDRPSKTVSPADIARVLKYGFRSPDTIPHGYRSDNGDANMAFRN